MMGLWQRCLPVLLVALVSLATWQHSAHAESRFCEGSKKVQQEVTERSLLPCVDLRDPKVKGEGWILDKDTQPYEVEGVTLCPVLRSGLKESIVPTVECCSGYQGPLCDDAICTLGCANGGTCVAPEQCACPAGFQGSRCQYFIDVLSGAMKEQLFSINKRSGDDVINDDIEDDDNDGECP
eukprot:XP_011665901.1 PREDICTED: hedgehog-interacting protein-like [Strongylocentrotus purpuratus]